MSVAGKVRKALPFATAIFPGADVVIRALPLPTDFAIMIKVPTAVLCLAIAAFARTPKSKRMALRWALGGIALLTVYAITASLLLHSTPQKFAPGDYAVIGMWPTEGALAECRRRNITMEILRNESGPVEWSSLYGLPAQLASALLLGATYCASFALLTLAFKKLPPTDAPSEG